LNPFTLTETNEASTTVIMQFGHIAGLLLLSTCSATAVQESPVGKVVELLSSLEAKISSEGEAEGKAYSEFVDWCDESSTNTKFEITTAQKEKAELEADIAKEAADGQAADAQIEELAGSIATGEDQLKAATQVRDKEISDFAAMEAELVDSINTLDRAIAVLEREMAKNPALLQQQVDTSNMKAVLNALSTVIDAAAFAGADKQKLMALVQDKQGDEDSDLDLNAPAAAVYKTHSSSIVEVLEDLKEKAEEELAEARKLSLMHRTISICSSSLLKIRLQQTPRTCLRQSQLNQALLRPRPLQRETSTSLSSHLQTRRLHWQLSLLIA